MFNLERKRVAVHVHIMFSFYGQNDEVRLLSSRQASDLSTELLMKVIGGRIRERRLKLGLSIEEVAKRSASSIELIKELEWSMLGDIDLDTLHSIAQATETSLSALLADDSVDELSIPPSTKQL